jgi:hypothetical protein
MRALKGRLDDISSLAGVAFDHVMQANVQMAPEARGTAVSLSASFLFLGQSLAVVLAAALIDRIGISAAVALGAG